MIDKTMDDLQLDDLVQFLHVGNIKDAPAEMVEYITTLEMIWRLHKRQLDFPTDDAVINHLVLVKKWSRPKAQRLFNDALTYFYTDQQLSIEVWKSRIANLGMKSFIGAIRTAKSTRDFKDAIWILLEMGKFLGWNLPEAEKPDENFLRQMQVVTADIEMFGLPAESRPDIAKFIDALPDISDLMKKKAIAEVDGVPFKLLYQGAENVQEIKEEDG